MEELTLKEIVKATGSRLLTKPDSTIELEDIRITSVCTNSKEVRAGTLFVPIIGEKVDAHDFIDSAFSGGAAASFTSRKVTQEQLEYLSEGKVYLQVNNTIDALQSLAAYYRGKFAIPVIGITGSVGKTTTKEMVAAALETKLSVLKTAGNQNSQIGLPLTVFNIEHRHDAAVIEMGMSEFGEMERIAKVARPDYAVMTIIGRSHIGNLGTQENIRKEKLHITDAFHEGSVLFFNNDDRLLTKDVIGVTGVPYGLEEDSVFRAEDVSFQENRTQFILHYPKGTERIELSVLGMHNVLNALAALAVAYQLGIMPETAKKGLKSYQPIAMRGNVLEANGYRIIDDSYNASPDSIKSGIAVLAALEDTKRRIAVLADVLELGEQSYSCHYDVGTYIGRYHKIGISNNKIDEVLTVGKEAKAILDGIHAESKEISGIAFETNAQAISYLKEHLQSKDTVLVKGSRGMHTEEIVKSLL